MKDCLVSVYKQTHKNFQVYFIDNGSVDGSSDYVRNNFPKTRIIQLAKNYGFAKGHNEGIKEALKDKSVEFVICLNNDTIVHKNWLRELIKTAEKNDTTGMVSSKAYFSDGNVQNAGLGLEKALQVNRYGGISIGFSMKDKGRLREEIEIFCPGGVAPLYKRGMLEEIGLFDEDFFTYAEDLDLGFRGRLAGWKAFLSPKAKLIHLHSQTSGVASPFKAYYSERNTFLTAIKNLPMILIPSFIYHNLKLKFSYLNNKNKSVEKLRNNIGFSKMFFILIKTHLTILVYLPKMLIKRWKIQSNKSVTNKEIKKWFEFYNREAIER